LPVRRWNCAQAATLLEARTEADLANIDLPHPHEYFGQLRIYLQRITDTGRTKNGARLLSRKSLENGDTQINAGPTIFREPCTSCIQFRSGAQLSFGITLRAGGARTSLLSYRFYLSLLHASGLGFVRIDLNAPTEGYDPLQMPRSHVHPGFEGIHIPFPVMGPLEVLDRIVHVIEPYFTP
jgi:hypothetical protein